ncbi:head-tail connector protein [Caldicoprobacter algeriensis]|nr:head-tail connector protein [Caldicoprobacter algeriensis]
MLDDVKTALRITNAAFDTEILDLIEAARYDLILAGVTTLKANDDTDPLIKRAIITYCKANFGFDNPDADRLQKSYDMIKMHLALAEDYNSYVITFIITAGGLPIDDAVITANGITKLTNSQGMAVFTVTKTGIDLDYVVSKAGYQTATGSVYIDGPETVEVALNAV